MGGCATKLRVLKVEGDAPEPQEQQLTLSDPTNKVEEEKEEDSKRISLGHLFKENEENKVASENEEITVKETISASQLESKGGEEEEEEEETKTEVPHFTEDSEIKTEEPTLSAPLNEEEKTMEVVESTVKEVSTVDSSSVDGELKQAVFEDKRGDDDVELPSTITVA